MNVCVCVFCGSGKGKNPVFAEAAQEMAFHLFNSHSTLIYGGGNIGLMGVLADRIMELGGKVIGVIPDFLLKKEVAHKGISQLEVVDSMHERKRRMADLADIFIALPGGWGTLDELAEILTWKQLGLIEGEIGILNTNNYFDALLSQMKTMVDEGFLHQNSLKELKISDSPHQLLIQLGVISV
ncbi:MAG: TIGR00730 family Rossman fold protein [Cyclobacteriaceae bacterium]|nr:TIGR00730 family Rossman fold protein [Cyclobacteriaceae bacterium]